MSTRKTKAPTSKQQTLLDLGMFTTAGESSAEETPPAPEPEEIRLPEPEFWTVGEVTRYLEALIKEDPMIGHSVRVRGELSNVKHSARGHVYFTLKDTEASISGIVWGSQARLLPFKLEDGLAVDITGKLEIYAPNGTYSLVSQRVEPVGAGAIQLAFEQLKQRLAAEGLFSPEYKKPLPEFPLKIGIVTSRTGAVIHDMMRVIRRKNQQVDVLIVPVKVQGEGAAKEIAEAITELNRPEYKIDVMIVGRGGGSLEDLFCFSEEPVVRAIFASRVPVLTGIGHEPDYSLADAVADHSASTPTAAAERAVPDTERTARDLAAFKSTLLTEMARYLYYYEQTLDMRATEFVDALTRSAETAELQLDRMAEQLVTHTQHTLQRSEQFIAQAAATLDAYNPLTTLARGFSVVTGPQGQLVQSIAAVQPGDTLQIKVSDGSIQCEVQTTHGQPAPAP